MSSRWWRAYDEAVDDPKLQRLGPALGWAWFNLMCVASKHNGVLPPIGDVAFKLRTTEQRAAATITALVSAGLFERNGNGQFAPHNWSGRQFQSDVSTERVQRFRKQKRNVSSTVSETPPDTESEADTEPEQKKEPRACALVGDWPSDAFDRFWAEYPTKIARKAALRAFATAKRSGVKFETVMFGLARYKAEKPPQIEWCHPATWLNGGRWDDQPAASAPNGQRTSGAPRRSGADDFFAGIAEVAANIGRDSPVARPADADIPRGRFEFDAEPTRRN